MKRRTISRMERVITVTSWDYDSVADDLAYWLSRPPEERLKAVDLLRHRVFDLPAQMDRIHEVADLGYD